MFDEYIPKKYFDVQLCTELCILVCSPAAWLHSTSEIWILPWLKEVTYYICVKDPDISFNTGLQGFKI